MFFAADPGIIGFAVILIVGWCLASLVGRAVVSLLHAVRFDGFAERAGSSDFFRKADKKNDASGVIAAIARWLVRLLALGLSSGLGGRDMAGAIVRRWYGRGQEENSQVERSPDAENEMSGRSYVAANGERRSGTTDRRAHQGGQA